MPDALTPIVRVDTAGSTNDLARSLLETREPPFAVVAREQTAGRGQYGRMWASPPGGLWLSVAAPDPTQNSAAGALAIAAGLAVIEACAPLVPSTTTLSMKWPNDVLLDDAKLAGILCERVDDPSHPVAIVGVGVNANMPTESLSPALRWPAATLLDAREGEPVDLGALAGAVADSVCARLRALDGNGLPASAVAKADHALHSQGRPVEASRPNGEVTTGTLLGVDPRGGARLGTERGEHVIYAGELRAASSAASNASNPDA